MFIVHSPVHDRHATTPPIPGYGRGYPEVPDRIDRIHAAVAEAGFGSIVAPTDFGLAPIEAVHDAGLIAHLRTAFAESRSDFSGDEPCLPDTFAIHGRRPLAPTHPGAFGSRAFDVSCPIFAGTWEASYSATQAAITAADHVRTHGGTAYAMVRPPGHHAGPNFHGGFCYTNHAAAAARHLQRTTNQPVALLDIDYHHGNGTQEIFAGDSTVFFASLHADPRVDYPYYWGFADDLPETANLNVPLPHGIDDDAYSTALLPVLNRVKAFDPKFLVLSAGFDLMAGDPVPRNGGFHITTAGLTRIAAEIAGLGIPTVIVQEGGYNLSRLGEYATTLLREFA